MSIVQSTVRLTSQDRDNIRRIMAYLRKMNKQAGITSPVSQNDAIQFALHRFAEELRTEGKGEGDDE